MNQNSIFFETIPEEAKYAINITREDTIRSNRGMTTGRNPDTLSETITLEYRKSSQLDVLAEIAGFQIIQTPPILIPANLQELTLERSPGSYDITLATQKLKGRTQLLTVAQSGTSIQEEAYSPDPKYDELRSNHMINSLLNTLSS
jgi:hypothetical protein